MKIKVITYSHFMKYVSINQPLINNNHIHFN